MAGALINVDVNDIKRAETFYCQAFGVTVARRFGPHAIELVGLGVPCYLLEKKDGTDAFRGGQQKRDYQRHWTPVHLDITIPDIQASYHRAIAAGARAESDIKDAPYGKIVLMSDPFGHGFCLIEFNEKGYDAIVT
jgi:predicted enzyme related to lactoylglutathione lyase